MAAAADERLPDAQSNIVSEMTEPKNSSTKSPVLQSEAKTYKYCKSTWKYNAQFGLWGKSVCGAVKSA